MAKITTFILTNFSIKIINNNCERNDFLMKKSKKILIISIVVGVIIAIAVVMFILGGNSTVGINGNNSKISAEEQKRQQKIQSYESFNKNFTKYEGDSVSGKDVNELIKTVRSSRLAFTFGKTKQIVSIKGLKSNDNVDDNKTFRVWCSYDDDGYVKEIYVYEQY